MLDIKQIEEMIEQGYITRRKHPCLPLWVLNYSPSAVFDKMWNSATLACRGLVIDEEWNIIARPFKKFFNYEEIINDPKLGNVPRSTNFTAGEKLDGSLGVLFFYKGEPIITTRGSFASDQAVYAQANLMKKYNLSGWNKGWTFLVEIIAKFNRIVIDYGDMEELVLLGIIDTATGRDLDVDVCETVAKKIGFPYAKNHHFDNLQEVLDYMVEHDTGEEEGFVLTWPNGFRLKVKFKEYCRLHKFIIGFNARAVWESMKVGTLQEFAINLPEEYQPTFDKIVMDLTLQFLKIEVEYLKAYTSVVVNSAQQTRKELAEHFTEYKYPAILFNIFDGKDYSDRIWTIIRPGPEKIEF